MIGIDCSIVCWLFFVGTSLQYLIARTFQGPLKDVTPHASNQYLGHEPWKSASKIRIASFVPPSKIFVWGASNQIGVIWVHEKLPSAWKCDFILIALSRGVAALSFAVEDTTEIEPYFPC
jgi:hypothetical protein